MEYNGRLKDFENEICMGTGVKGVYMKVFDASIRRRVYNKKEILGGSTTYGSEVA